MISDKHYEIVKFFIEEFNRLKNQASDGKIQFSYKKKKRIADKITNLLSKIDTFIFKVDFLHSNTREELIKLQTSVKNYLEDII